MIEIYFGNDEKAFIDNIIKNIKQKTILIVPDQYSFYTEKIIYEKTKNSSLNENLEVFSFKKLCLKIFKEYGYIAGKFATKLEKILILNLCLFKIKNELKNFKKNITISQNILKSIEELEKNDISPKTFKEKIEKINDKDLKIKSKELYKIFSLYEKTINKNFKNPTKNIKKAIEFSIKNNIFNNKRICFIMFFRFNNLEINLIEIIMKQGNLIFLFPFEEKRKIFNITKKTIDTIEKIAKKNKIKIKTENYEEYKIKSEEIRAIEKNLFKKNKKKYLKNTKKIKIYLTNSKESEIENAVEKIIKLEKKGVKLNEIAVIANNLELYSAKIKTYLKNFNIPYFFNEDLKENNMVLVNIAKNILEITINLDIKIYLTILKSSLTKFNEDEIIDFENYVEKFKINKKNINFPFKENLEDEEENKKIKNAEKIRKTLNKILTTFKKSKNLAKDIGENLVKSFSVLGIINKIETEIKDEIELNNFKEEWEFLIDILEKMHLITKKQTISKNQFQTIFNSVLKEVNIKKIPQIENCVLISSFNEEIPKDKKALLIVGASDDIFEKQKYLDEFFTNDEIKKLKNVSLKFLLTLEEKNSIKDILKYKIITSSSEYLFVFSSDNSDKYSDLVKELTEIFGDIIIKKIYEKNYFKSYLTEEIAFKKLLIHYNEKTDEIKTLKNYFKDKIKNFIDEKTKEIKIPKTEYIKTSISPSQIEQFFLCPFSYFCRYILKIEDNKKNEEKKDLGNIIHKILEDIVSLENFLELDENKLEEKIKENITLIISENLKEKTKKNSYLLREYKNLFYEIKTICIYIKNELNLMGFKPSYFEYLVSENSKIKPLNIKIDENLIVSVSGIIDRIDIKKIGNKKFLRIIDYKYKKKSFNYCDFLNGLNMQIIIYLILIFKSRKNLKNVEIAGIFYMPTLGVLKKYELFKQKPTEEKLKNLLYKKLKPDAIIIDSKETEKILEKIKTPEYKNYSPIRATQNNLFNKQDADKCLITKDELKDFCSLIEEKVKFMFNCIEKLEFNKSPKNLPQSDVLYCNYCEFNKICYEEEIEKPKKQKNINKLEFFNIVNKNKGK